MKDTKIGKARNIHDIGLHNLAQEGIHSKSGSADHNRVRVNQPHEYIYNICKQIKVKLISSLFMMLHPLINKIPSDPVPATMQLAGSPKYFDKAFRR